MNKPKRKIGWKFDGRTKEESDLAATVLVWTLAAIGLAVAGATLNNVYVKIMGAVCAIPMAYAFYLFSRVQERITLTASNATPDPTPETAK